jgi:hypothetical protein
MSATPPIWTPENGALLQQLRLNAKVDIGTLAQKNIVSRSQIKQLEDGGDSSFYSPEIKYQIGKKVLASLGHKLAPVMAPQQVVTAAPLAPAPQPQVVEQPDLPALKTPAMAQATAATSQQGDAGSNKVTMGLLLIAGLCGLAWFLLQSGTLNELTAPSQQVLTKANVPETTAAPPAPEPASVAPVAANSVNNAEATNAPPVTPPATPAAPEASKAEVKVAMPSATDDAKNCLWKDDEVELQAPAPKKAAEYVYIVAGKDSFVCVMDGNERVARLTMKKGEDRSVYGNPPFKVQSADLAQLKIYFQGQGLSLPSAETKQIKLTAAALK